MCASGIIITDISDHFPSFCQINIKNEYVKPPKYMFCRRYTAANINNLYHDLYDQNILSYLDHDHYADPNVNYYVMESILTTALNKHIPIQKIKIQRHKHKQGQWITFGILRSIKFRDNMYKKFKLTAPNTIQSLNIKQNLVTYNRILKRTIREDKYNYYKFKFDRHRSDSKETWQLINEVINKKTVKKGPEYLIVNDNKLTDTKKMIDCFNTYFGNIGMEMAASVSSIPGTSHNDFLKEKYTTSFKFNNIQVKKTTDIIKTLKCKTSYGHDGISNNLLKKLEPVLSTPLT